MLTDLEARWRDERTPQAGVRLAEALQEEGHKIRAEGILEVVERRLEEHPRDLASRVAVGAVWLALGRPEAAARVLEEVVEADATHLKANKLLVEVYLELDQRDRARDRLDLYRLLNEGDPEIEALEGLLVGVVAAPPTESAGAGGRRLSVAAEDPFADLSWQPTAAAVDDLFPALASPPAAVEEGPAATATLGALYREQGHSEEAARIFGELTGRELDGPGAREGLESLARDAAAAAARRGPALAAGISGPDPDFDRERRIGILRDYLDRIRRGREAAAR